MRLSLLLIIITFTWVACTNKNRLPGGILRPSAMQDLVWDVMVADEYSKDVMAADTTKSKTLKKERSMVYQQVFDLHKTSREDFVKSFNYYTSHPDLTKVLFDTLTARANKSREEAFRATVPGRIK